MEQRTPEWFAARLGKLTASRVADAFARTKTGWGASRANYMAQLVAERLTGQSQDSYTNAAMQWGTDTEPEAIAAYQFYRDAAVMPVGFVDHLSIHMSGASPDGLVDEVGLIEVKCPNTATHIETLRGGSVPGKYLSQIQWQLACTTRDWCDFISYDPRMPEEMRLFVERVNRDDRRIAELETLAREFLAEVDATVADLMARYGRKEAA